MRRNSSNASEQIPHYRTLPDHTLELVSTEDLALQSRHLVTTFGFRRNAADTKAEIRDGNRLRQVIAGPFLDRFQSRFGGIVTRHQQDFRVGTLMNDRLQQLHAVVSRQDEIENRDIRLFLQDQLPAFGGIR